MSMRWIEDGKAWEKDVYGNPRQLQGSNPVMRPEGEPPDCAFCIKKVSCMAPKNAGAQEGRSFYVGEKYSPCNGYSELNEEEKKQARLREQRKIFDPIPRPEGQEPDCLYCRMLRERRGILCRSGPYQGLNRVCDNYHEIKARPAGEARHCLNCLDNFDCEYGRVVRDGKPCEKYREYSPGVWEQKSGQN